MAGAGTELEKIIHEYMTSTPKSLAQVAARMLIRLPGNSNCGCADLARKMDSNGPMWCRSSRAFLVSNVYRNAVKHSIFHSASLVESEAKRIIGEWIDRAICAAENGSEGS